MSMVAAAHRSGSGSGSGSGPQQGLSVWALIDAFLLCMILMLSADVLVQVRAVQSPLWLLCYALTLLRIAVVLPAFLAVLGRNWVLLLFPGLCLASVLWSVAPGESLAKGIQLAMTMLMGIYLGWRYSMVVLIKVLAVLLSVAVALSLLHWATGVFPWPVYTRVGGLNGIFSSKNMLGLRALFAVVALIAILMMSRREVGPLFRQLSVLALGLSLFALALSLSMTSVLLLPPMAGLLLMLCWRHVPPVLVTGAVVTALGLISLGPVLMVAGQINPVEELLGAVGKSSTLTGRTDIWAVAVDVYRAHPVLGVGYVAFWDSPQFLNERLRTIEAGALTSRSFHNFILEILVSAGWAAVLAMAALLWTAVRRMARAFAATGSVAMAAGLSLMLGVVVSSLTGTSLYRGHEIMLILAVAFAVSAGEEGQRAP